MEKYHYPDKDYHIKQHNEFIEELKEFRANHKSHSHSAIQILTNNIGDWIKRHILENDQKLGKFILEKEKNNLLKLFS